MSLPAPLTKALGRFLDEEAGREALAEAGRIAAHSALDLDELFDWLQRQAADPSRRQQAQAALRAALGLPLIPGPPCRSV